MFQPSTSGVGDLAQEIDQAVEVSYELKDVEAQLAQAKASSNIANYLAALAAAETLVNSPLKSDSAFFKELQSKAGALADALKTDTKIVVQNCSYRGGDVTVKDSNGNDASLGSFNPSASYSWSTHVDEYKDVNWCPPNAPSGVHATFDSPPCNDTVYDVNANAPGSDVEQIAQVQVGSTASNAINDFLNSF